MNCHDDAEDYVAHGLAYAYSDMKKEAIQTYKQAIKIDSESANAYFRLGAAYRSSNDRDSALEQYKKIKTIDPELANVLLTYINE